ncbi:uncharacterized protein DFL_006558 [Arthrobotrys flagrans]|uniref:Zn(2)-C6 fungal-type domain-containing protein n=1 Tax=Arthrobotrys flagrans TaxID=97331 RepID=A0A436ZT50_ARTFL|nr:hypothetical protein DFL_006558 [Arthrobotrys flagrans]
MTGTPETVNLVSPPDQASPEDAVLPHVAPSAGTSSSPKPHAFNCVVCKNRKVKCDRQVPCSTCTKLNVECQYVEPGPRKKRKSSSKHENLVQRLNRYEELLKQVESNVKLLDGVELPSSQKGDSLSEGTTWGGFLEKPEPERQTKRVKFERPSGEFGLCAPKKGGLLASTGRSRYFENNLWNSLKDELQELKETILDSSDDDKGDDYIINSYASNPNLGTGIFFFGPVGSKYDISGFHPSAAHCMILWNCFLENINPLNHVVHHPSLAVRVMEYKDKPHKMPRNLEALMFSIYALTVSSLDSRQCLSLFQESRNDLLARYRFAAQHALKNAGALKTTDLIVLQALVFFLLDLRSYYDYPSLWVITGTAVRIAQRMGVHRDGTKLNLPPFETEMRRRLWREILILDFRTAELSGAGLYTMAMDENAWDSKWPASINETDIWPGMTEPPKEREGPTENMWPQLRGELGQIFVDRWRRIHRQSLNMETMYDKADPNSSEFANFYKALDNDQQLEEITSRLEEKYIRHCDPINPLQLFTSIICRSALTNLRLMTHHPIRRPDNGAGMSQEEKDSLFSDSIKIMEYDNLCHSSRSIQKFLWHTKSFFQWHAFIYLLGELRQRPQGPEVEKAWAQVDEVFEHHYEWLERKDELHSAIRALALKAWENRETQIRKAGKVLEQEVRIPVFVQTLREMYASSNAIAMAGPAPAHKGTSSEAVQGPTIDLGPTPLQYLGTPATTTMQQQGFPYASPNRDVLDNGINIASSQSGGTTSAPSTNTISSSGPEVISMSPPTTTATTTTNNITNTTGAGGAGSTASSSSSSTSVTPINWSEWENLLQNSDLLGFTGAFRGPYEPLYNWQHGQ